MTRLLPLIVFLRLLHAAQAEAPFIPKTKLPQLIGTEVEISGIWSRMGRPYTPMDVLNPEGELAYPIWFDDLAQEADQALKKVQGQGKAVRCTIRGKLYWTGRDWLTKEEKRGAVPHGGGPNGFYVSGRSMVSWEIIDDPKTRYVGQKFPSQTVEPFLGSEGEHDGFYVRNEVNGEVTEVGYLDGPDHWHEDIRKAVLSTKKKNQTVKLKFVGLIKGWEWKDGKEHYHITMWSAQVIRQKKRQ